MRAELAHERIKRLHLGGVRGRDGHFCYGTLENPASNRPARYPKHAMIAAAFSKFAASLTSRKIFPFLKLADLQGTALI